MFIYFYIYISIYLHNNNPPIHLSRRAFRLKVSNSYNYTFSLPVTAHANTSIISSGCVYIMRCLFYTQYMPASYRDAVRRYVRRLAAFAVLCAHNKICYNLFVRRQNMWIRSVNDLYVRKQIVRSDMYSFSLSRILKWLCTKGDFFCRYSFKQSKNFVCVRDTLMCSSSRSNQNRYPQNWIIRRVGLSWINLWFKNCLFNKKKKLIYMWL